MAPLNYLGGYLCGRTAPVSNPFTRVVLPASIEAGLCRLGLNWFTWATPSPPLP